MININFDNPWYLLIAIPLLAAVFIPFFIAIRKYNRSLSVVLSVILHVFIVALVALAAAGTNLTATITKTEVYVVADVSYSSNKNLDKVDEYIEKIEDALPDNSEMGVICFGRDYQLFAPLGENVESVKGANVDDSATNIAKALDYASTLFNDGVIKRIVLITDGKTTDGEVGDFISAVENLYAKDIYIDAMYLNNNPSDSRKEVQISDVDYTPSAYLNHTTSVDVLVQSSYDTKGIVSLLNGGEEIYSRAVNLTKGFNVVNFELTAEAAGASEYEVRVQASDKDVSNKNNSYRFTQVVEEKLQVLLVTTNSADVTKAETLYGEGAEIDAYVNEPSVPCTVEDLCKYDEIILSDVDVTTLHNASAFVQGLDAVVSRFGKSLVTMGNMEIQNREDVELLALEDMLPVRYGNDDQDPKLVTIVLDGSRSMMSAYHFDMAKQAAISLINMLDERDSVAVIAFSGDATVMNPVTPVTQKQTVIDSINALEVTQGTLIGNALQLAYDNIKNQPFVKKQVILISDGRNYEGPQEDDPLEIAQNMRYNGIPVSAINTQCQDGHDFLENLTKTGGGKYYYIEDERSVDELIFSQVADDVTETLIERNSVVMVDRSTDEVMNGLIFLPNLHGYMYSQIKPSATKVLYTEYEKETGETTEAPVYSYWDYGNGRVSTFASRFTGEWIAEWENDLGNRFFANIALANTPEERIDYPYTLSVETNGQSASIEVIPVELDPTALAVVKVTMPDGTQIESQCIFDSTCYYLDFATSQMGKYTLTVTYTRLNKEYVAEKSFYVSYYPEYDEFTTYNVSDLHKGIRHRGTVYENGEIKLENDMSEIATYKLDFTLPFVIAAVALFVVDVMVRKLKWNDIKGLFVKTKKKTRKGD